MTDQHEASIPATATSEEQHSQAPPDDDLSSKVAEKWVEIAPLIDVLMERMGRRDDFPVKPDSALAGDDRASSPYQVSHVVKACLSAAVDHLHAAKVLVHDCGLLHLAAPATLARGAIENAATGLWVLTPRSRDERVLRALRWHSRNYRDQAATGRTPPGKPLEFMLSKIAKVATQRGLPEGSATGGYQMTKVIQQVQTGHPDLGDLLLTWQLGSGFAHGRPWAYLGALEREEFDAPEEGVTNMRLTSYPVLAMHPILKSLHLVERLLQVREKRAGLHRHTAIPTVPDSFERKSP